MGVGNLQGMRVILRNNRQLLRKTGLFKKNQSFLSSRKEYLKAAKGEVDFKTISKSELRALREKVIKNRKTENLRTWIITLVIIAPILFYGVYFFYQSSIKNQQILERQQQNTETNKILLDRKENQKLNADLNRYFEVISEGDLWIEKKNWNNAIYKYEQAVRLFPNEFEANYRLVLAYSYRCQNENKNCEVGKKLMNRLLKYFPEESNLIELKRAFEK